LDVFENFLKVFFISANANDMADWIQGLSVPSKELDVESFHAYQFFGLLIFFAFMIVKAQTYIFFIRAQLESA